MAQNVVGRGDVKEELRDAEGQEQRVAAEGSLDAVAKPENDLLLAGAVDRRRAAGHA